MAKVSRKYIVQVLKRKLEEATGKKVKLVEEPMPDFLKYDNLFGPEKDDDGGGVITKPKPTTPTTAPSKPTKPKSPLSPTQPVVKPKPKA